MSLGSDELTLDVQLKVVLLWIVPPTDTAERIRREQCQHRVNVTCANVANELRRRLLESLDQ